MKSVNILLLSVLGLVCCCGPDLTQPNFVSSRDEAAGVTLSATAAPWDEISSTIQPKFSLTATAALQQVLPITQQGESEDLNAIGAGLGISFLAGPFRATPSNTTSADTTPSSLPSATIPTGVPAGGILPSASGGFSPTANPSIMYNAAASLYEAVQLLNTALTSATLRQGYVPYVVRIKLGVLPYKPNLPYDLTAHISFFSQPSCSDGQLQPVVVPLLATDDLERASESRAAEASSQLSLALGFLAPYIGGNANLNHLRQKLDTLAGQNFDSTLTVAREVDNTLIVRIGAAYQAAGGKAIIGQNYDVSTILLIPTSMLSPSPIAECQPPSVSLVSYTDFRNTFTGAVLPNRSKQTAVRLADAAVEADLDSEARDEWLGYSESERFDLLTTMLNDIQSDYYKDFVENIGRIFYPNVDPKTHRLVDPHVCDHMQSSDCLSIQNAAQLFWSRLTEINTDSSSETAAISLKSKEVLSLPDQVVTVADDGKSNSVAELQINPTIYFGKVIGNIEIKTEDKKGNSTKFTVFSENSIVDLSSNLLTMQFPSISNMGITGIVSTGSHLQLSLPCQPANPNCAQVTPSDFPISYVLAKGTAGPAPDFMVTSSSKVISEQHGGVGTLTLSISKLSDGETATISLDGAQITAVSNGNLTMDGAVLSTNGLITLSLGNLVPNVSVTVQVQGNAFGKPTAKTSIVIPVVADISPK